MVVLNVQVFDNINYNKTTTYNRNRQRYTMVVERWEENNLKGCIIALENCLAKLVTERQNQDALTEVEDARSDVEVSIFINGLHCNKNARKQSIMVTVGANLEVYVCAQKVDQTTGDYYKVLSSW